MAAVFLHLVDRSLISRVNLATVRIVHRHSLVQLVAEINCLFSFYSVNGNPKETAQLIHAKKKKNFEEDGVF
jgi:hypothetical protein